MVRVVIDYSKCTGVLSCIDVCPTNVFEKGEDGRAKVINEAECIVCRACESACPQGAITVSED
ncbi:ferredoxin family protein [Candidatus Woesearchaeota archaeon]|nr:ferredoxin family protein [Candidatus Woesearchaeota archaeon]